MATRHRPTRGKSGPEIEIGDPFGQYEKQGGAFEGASESGDLQSREFGVPQADIPGGLNHLINTEAQVEKTAHKGYQPADYHKYHGVPPIDEKGYTFPPKADEVGPVPRPEREPKMDDAVPVVIRSRVGPTGRQIIRKLITDGPFTITGPEAGSDPVPIADRDPNRVKFWICNETTAGGVGQAGPLLRIGDWETAADGRGLAIPADTIKDFVSQDRIFMHVASAVTVTYSYGYETEIEAAE